MLSKRTKEDDYFHWKKNMFWLRPREIFNYELTDLVKSQDKAGKTRVRTSTFGENILHLRIAKRGFMSSNITPYINVSYEKMSHCAGSRGLPGAYDQLGLTAPLSDSGGVALL